MENKEYANRRGKIMENLGEGVLIIASQPHATFSNDVEYVYRQHSDMIYFVNYPEPKTTCIIENKGGEVKTHLFVPKRDPLFETWNGRRYGVEGAQVVFEVDAHDNEELEEKLLEILLEHHTVFYDIGKHEELDALVISGMGKAFSSKDKTGTGPVNLINPRITIDDMRSVKSVTEIELMRKAAIISADAHTRAMKVTKPGMNESQIEAILDYEFRKHGSRGWAYPSIVGSGVNATILHYVENSSEMNDNELLLVDAACEYQGYAADITRTWPIGGKFNDAQRRVYQAVLDVQKKCIDMIKPGVVFWDIHLTSVRMITEKLIELGLLDGDVEKLIEDKKHRRFFMHGLGHWLGIDTHDSSSVDRKKAVLKVGNYVTIEPGIYIPDEEDIPQEFRGIGVRIEDDILVTKNGYENFTASVVKEIEDIEAIVGTEELP